MLLEHWDKGQILQSGTPPSHGCSVCMWVFQYETCWSGLFPQHFCFSFNVLNNKIHTHAVIFLRFSFFCKSTQRKMWVWHTFVCVCVCVRLLHPAGIEEAMSPEWKESTKTVFCTWLYLHVKVLRWHSWLFQNERCEFHKLNHTGRRGYCSGAIPQWVNSLGPNKPQPIITPATSSMQA